MFYLLSEKANIGRKIITENHPVVREYLSEKSDEWQDVDKIIEWLWGIDKKSNRILDLVEIGDLVETIDRTNIIRFMSDLDDIDPYGILNIYKKDGEGNYKLVWEETNCIDYLQVYYILLGGVYNYGSLSSAFKREIDIVEEGLEKLSKFEKIIKFLKLNFNISVDDEGRLQISDMNNRAIAFLMQTPEDVEADEIIEILKDELVNAVV